jgi:ABC-2 type transport system ATP-binding protein
MEALSITNLEKTYSGGVHAIKGISLSIEENDFFALLGPNGAGKSTTIGVITNLIRKSSGEVKIFGHDSVKESEIAKQYIGVVPQEFNFNIFEDVIDFIVNQAGYYGIERKLALERAEKYLKKLSLWEKRNEKSFSLSGGMKRKLMIVRALIHEPKLLILDEPTAGVDVETRRDMWEFLKELNKSGTTIILTTHYLEEAEHLCKNIAIINGGKVVIKSSMSNLLKKLNKETFVLDLNKKVEIKHLKDYEIAQVDDTTIEVGVGEKQDLNDLFKQLSDHDVKVLSMRAKMNRLEELFVSLIGGNDERVE